MSLDQEIEAILAHHGVKGMKWGVRNIEKSAGRGKAKAEAFVKDKAQQTKSKLQSTKEQLQERNVKINTERKATLRARGAKAAVRIKEIDDQLASPDVKPHSNKAYNLKYEKSILVEQRTKDLRKAEKQSTTGLTSGQKKVLIGAGVAAGVLATYGAYRLLGTESGRARVRSLASKAQHGDVFKKDPALAEAKSLDQIMGKVVKGINPNYSSQGGKMNCRRCTFAYELRRRGYDVEATTAMMGQGQNETGLVNALIKGDKNIRGASSMSANSSWNTDNPLGIRTRNAGDTRITDAFQETVKFFDEKDATSPTFGGLSKNVFNALSKHPEGARGEIVFDERAFAHSLQWEIIGGKPHLFDSQKGQHFPVTENGLKDFATKWGFPESADITRLDNVDLDLAFLSQWAKNT